jgi:hypothetical protein
MEELSNVPSDLWAEALAVYETDTGLVNRSNAQRRRHQQNYENQGISPSEVRRRYKEAQMTDEERLALYATEQVSRRALDLWSSANPEDFDNTMERAARTPVASADASEKLAAARRYNSGYNGAVHRKQTRQDNPHEPGTPEYADWDRGCRDGMAFFETLADEKPGRESAPMRPATETVDGVPVTKIPERKRGRKPGSKNKSKEAAPEPPPAESSPPPPADEPGEGLFSTMPALPA